MRRTGGFRVLNYIRSKSTKRILIILLFIYLILNIVFGFTYYILDRIDLFYIDIDYRKQEYSTDESSLSIKRHSLCDCIYFSFVTASTVGYGDIYPNTNAGKMVVMMQSVICALYTAIMMSIITSKLLWSKTDTVVFSHRIIINTWRKVFHVRIINTNSMPIINPEIRVSLTEHVVGDVIARKLELNNRFAQPSYLGRHDFTISFGFEKINNEEGVRSYEIVLNELLNAIMDDNSIEKSRFRIVVTISGNNGVQSIVALKKYTARDFVCGTGFAPIKYNGKDEDEFGIKYDKIKDFWDQFEKVENEKTLEDGLKSLQNQDCLDAT